MSFSRCFCALSVFAALGVVGCSSSSGGNSGDPGEDTGLPGDETGSNDTAATPPAPIGGACTTAEACLSGECTAEWPAGYCTKAACTTGSCGDGAECYEL